MSRLITKESLEVRFKQFGKLDGAEQKHLREQYGSFVEAQYDAKVLFIRAGFNLIEMQKLLFRKGLWEKFCRSMGIDRFTARRWMEGVKAVQAALPKAVFAAAIRRGMDIMSRSADPTKLFGEYTESIEALPMPKPDIDDPGADKYLDKVEDHYEKHLPKRRRGVGTVDAETVRVRAYRSITNAYKTISGPKKRQEWAEQLIGALMTSLGYTAAHEFAPQAPPKDWLPKPVGRPKAKPGETVAE